MLTMDKVLLGKEKAEKRKLGMKNAKTRSGPELHDLCYLVEEEN